MDIHLPFYLQYAWVLRGFANAIIMMVLGRMMLASYASHPYLYQFEDKNRAFDTRIDFLVPYVKRLGISKYRESLTLFLSRAGTRKDWDSNHFIASQILISGIVMLTAFVLIVILLGGTFVWMVMLGSIAFALPYIKLSDTAAARARSCTRELPYFIDYLNLAMGSGLDFNQALKIVSDDSPDSALNQEFSLVLRNMRLGMAREDALTEMERRLGLPSLKVFIQTLIQGMRMGTDIGQTLQAMSDTIQTKRFQAAEEMAGKISIRMMIPMMVFVMPSVMIVLLGPMLLAYFQT